MNNETVRLLAGGPLVLLLTLSCLAVAAVAAAGAGRAGKLVFLSARAVRRLERPRAPTVLWGLAAGVLIFIVCAALLSVPALGLLGLVASIGGLVLVGLGVWVAAVAVGNRYLRALASETPETLSAARLGLSLFFAAAFLPLLGWSLVLLAAAFGIGGVLEALSAARRRDDPPA